MWSNIPVTRENCLPEIGKLLFNIFSFKMAAPSFFFFLPSYLSLHPSHSLTHSPTHPSINSSIHPFIPLSIQRYADHPLCGRDCLKHLIPCISLNFNNTPKVSSSYSLLIPLKFKRLSILPKTQQNIAHEPSPTYFYK